RSRSPTRTCAPPKRARALRLPRGEGADDAPVFPAPGPRSPVPDSGVLHMIGRLRGILIAKRPPWVLVEVGGIGYELEVPMSTLYDMPDAGKEVVLLTHYAHKEDTVALYGFLREDERTLFRDLQ